MLLGLMAGAGVAAGLICVAVGLAGGGRPPRRWHLDGTRSRQVGAGVAAGLIVLVVTRWVAVSVAVGVLVAGYDRLFGGTRRARLAIARLEALAGWTESLRDMIATGLALPEALPASVAAAAPVIRPQLTMLSDRLAAREPVGDALRALADGLDDPGADLVIAALILNTRAQGRALQNVLGSLSRSARAELAVRRSIDAERRSTRRAVQFVVGVTVVTALGLAVGNPTYVAPYRGVTGQLVLAVVVGIFAVGFAWLARLAAMAAPDRFLGDAAAAAEVTA
jgi:Flp pilus assembly protein TadB